MSHVPAADSTLRILSHMASQRGPVPAQSIAQALGIPRSSIYQLLQVLCENGYVMHIPEEKRYGLGPTAFELSSAYSRQQPLTRVSAPLMAKLVDILGESAHLAILHSTDVLYVVEERASNRPSLVSDVGVRLPAHLTASGRALLSALPAAQLRALYSSSALPAGGNSGALEGPTQFRELKKIVAEAAELGYATENSEITQGFASVAVAVRDHLGWPAAAVAVTFAHPNYQDVSALEARIAEFLPMISSTAKEIGRRIHGTN